MPFLHILLDLKELYQELLGVGIGFVQPPLDPTGAQHPSAWVGPGEAQDVINFLATASFDEFAVHFKDKGGVGRNVRRRAILAVGHSSRNGQRHQTACSWRWVLPHSTYQDAMPHPASRQ